MTSPRILLVHAHSGMPPSRVNRRMAQAARTLPHVVVNDLYETYPDFDIDVPREQSLLAAADLVILHHPVQWYGMPSLLKEWLDLVLTHGWAYGDGGTALSGKECWLAATTGGSVESYSEAGIHGFAFDRFLPPYIQTARLCGMHWLPPLVLHGAHQVDDAAIETHVTRFVALLATYPSWDIDGAGHPMPSYPPS